MPKYDNPLCSMCAKLRRGIWRKGFCWRICSTCDEGRQVAPSDDDDGPPPERENAPV